MQIRNFNIATRSAKVLTFELCTPSTASFGCTSYPVFSGATTDGTARYQVDSPLKQLSPAGLFRTENFPAVVYNATSGTGTITFTYGVTFSNATEEYEAGSDPRRYKYFLHLAGASPGTAYSAAYTADANMILGGTINVLAAPVTASAVADVCSISLS